MAEEENSEPDESQKQLAIKYAAHKFTDLRDLTYERGLSPSETIMENIWARRADRWRRGKFYRSDPNLITRFADEQRKIDSEDLLSPPSFNEDDTEQ